MVLFIHREDIYYTEDEWEQNFPGRPYPKNIAEIVVGEAPKRSHRKLETVFPRHSGSGSTPWSGWEDF